MIFLKRQITNNIQIEKTKSQTYMLTLQLFLFIMEWLPLREVPSRLDGTKKQSPANPNEIAASLHSSRRHREKLFKEKIYL